MKILARLMTADLYNCKNSKLQEPETIEAMVRELLKTAGFNLLDLRQNQMAEDHYAIAAFYQQGHLVLHIYPALRYVAADIFLCEEGAAPEDIFKGLRRFFKPDKNKTTFLKRGDFTSPKDVRPKIKTHVAPLRRIHNTGAKVIRILARRSRQ